MSYVSSFLVSFCAAAVFIGALYMLCPDGAMNKSIKYLLSLVFLLSVISVAGITVKNAGPDISFSPPEASNTAELELSSARYVYSYALSSSGIEFSEIEIFTDKTEDGSISINKVIIHSGCERQKIIDALGEATKNIEVEVIDD